jgi:transcriptional regulator with XRE-family HTH domain
MKRSTPEETRVALGQRLRQLRREKNMSQADLGQAAGLHYTHVGRLERGAASPTAGALQRLAGALDVSVEYLLEGAEQQAVRVSIEDRELLRQFQEVQGLPQEDKQVVKTLLDALLLRRKIQTLALP